MFRRRVQRCWGHVSALLQSAARLPPGRQRMSQSSRRFRACLKRRWRSAPVPRAQKGGRVRDPGIVPCRRTFGRFCARGRAHSASALSTQKTNAQTGSQPERCSRKSRTEVCRAGRTALPACPRVHQREHQTVWPNERSFSSAHRLAGRDRQDACPTFYCIVPDQPERTMRLVWG